VAQPRHSSSAAPPSPPAALPDAASAAAGEPAISQLRELPLARLARERGVYLSFNNGRDTEYCIRAHLEPTQLRDWQREVRAQTHSWRRMMAADLGPPPAACGGYCCTQFLVSADRIRARPHSFWRAFP